MCEVLEIHRSTYYKYLHFKDPDYYDYTVMKETFDQHKKTLGCRRLSAILREQTGWMTYTTYLTLYKNGPRVHLSSIIDLETRQWVAYKISLKNDLDLVVETLKEAIHSSKEKDLNGLVLHSD